MFQSAKCEINWTLIKCNVSSLCGTNVGFLPEQRPIYPEHVVNIETGISKGLLPPPIMLATVDTTGQYYVVDGQHRLLAYKNIYIKNGIDNRIDVLIGTGNMESVRSITFMMVTQSLPQNMYGVKSSLELESKKKIQLYFDNMCCLITQGKRVNRPRVLVDSIVDVLYGKYGNSITEEILDEITPKLNGSCYSIYSSKKTYKLSSEIRCIKCSNWLGSIKVEDLKIALDASIKGLYDEIPIKCESHPTVVIPNWGL